MGLKFYNSNGRSLQPFEPLKANQVGFYGCGPTVYDYAHIGNLRAYVFHDYLVRTLKRAGFSVTHVMNITDIGHLTGDIDNGDDKMIRSAEERGKSVLDIANFFTEAFFRDTDRLNIKRPNIICKATDHIDDMIALISRIEANGYTYSAGGNLYFDISKFPRYGEMANIRIDELMAGARVILVEHKKNPLDFALWFTKSKFPDQALVWDSPWGRGYPGWHIECSAMSIKYLGESFDIHAGGVDHINIHHTNEIAQSEAATGQPWVRYWLHNEFLVMDKAKMSKSAGSFLTLQNLIDAGYDPIDFRYFLLGGHYRTQLQFSFEALDNARNARRNLLERLRQIAEKAVRKPELIACQDQILSRTRISQRDIGPATKYLEAFDQALNQDLSIPRALAELWNLLRDPAIKADEALETALEMDGILGLDLGSALVPAVNDPTLVSEIEALIKKRDLAKQSKDFAQADTIRSDLRERGIVLEDGPTGTVWRHA